MSTDSSPTEVAAAHEEVRPRVSVVMELHRIDPFLDAAIASILNQTFSDFEFLIVVDRTRPEIKAQILRQYAHETRIRFIDCPPLGGLSLAFNLGIGEARGEYIARMDGDDISLPTRLEEQLNHLDEHLAVAVLGCRLQLIDAHSNPIDRTFPHYSSNRAIRGILPFRNPMPHPALMMRKSTLLAVGGYKYGHASEDYELFLRIARNPQFEFHNLDRVLLQHRRHDLQTTNAGYFKQRFAEMSGYLFTEFLRTRSPKYLLAIVALHPGARRMRKALLGH